MGLPLDFVPAKPFPDFKWKWASLQCTEGLNDPVVLLGVLFRMRKLELSDRGLKYSSNEFADELRSLAKDIEGRGIGVDLARRTGDRNVIRNSGQYWRAVGLIPQDGHDGRIRLTPFGRLVADRKISQTEFAALTIQTFTLPNAAVQSEDECVRWREAGLCIKPLRLLLSLLEALNRENGEGYLTPQELVGIVIPLSGVGKATIDDHVAFLSAFRAGKLDVSQWPDCASAANDRRIAREFLLFLANYGYVNVVERQGDERFCYNELLDDEIHALLALPSAVEYDGILARLKDMDVASEIERKRVAVGRRRPNQAKFRRMVLGENPRCIITNVTLPEVLEAAHIIPFKYHGEDSRANGLTMRMDIHQLFDSGHLRIQANGGVMLTDRARMDYGAAIPPIVHLPDWVNRDYVRWRWENYDGV